MSPNDLDNNSGTTTITTDGLYSQTSLGSFRLVHGGHDGGCRCATDDLSLLDFRRSPQILLLAILFTAQWQLLLPGRESVQGTRAPLSAMCRMQVSNDRKPF